MRASVADLARHLHSARSRWRSLVVLKAFFDESGTHAGSTIIGIGGYVAPADALAEIEDKWLKILAPYSEKGVRFFHMAEALAQQGQFALVDRPHLNFLIKQLSALLGDPRLAPIYSAVVREAWDTVTDPQFLDRFPTPLDLCFEDIVRQLWIWAARNADGEIVCPVFAYRQESHERMSEIGRVYGAQDWYKRVLGPIAFGYPEQFTLLQGADLFIHQLNADLRKRNYEEFSLATGGQTRALSQATGGWAPYGHWFDEDGLRLTVQRFRESGEIYKLTF